jgi:hypothetical protein
MKIVSVPRRVTGSGLMSEAHGFRLVMCISIGEIVDGILSSVISPG